jgi:hypothetical protein
MYQQAGISQQVIIDQVNLIESMMRQCNRVSEDAAEKVA